jgi:hypothetical protein
MSRHTGPWTFEPFVADKDTVWTIHDENEARVVAVFYAEKDASEYLAWVNKKQAKKKAKEQALRESRRAVWGQDGV